MRKWLLLLCCFLVLAVRQEISAVGEWTYYTAYQNVTASLPVDNRIYVLADGNLFYYDKSTAETTFLSRLTGLSDKGIAFMAYSDTQHCLVLAYESGNIDLLEEGGEVINMPELKNAYADNLAVNNLFVSGDEACISTDEGLVCLNLARKEVEGYYRLGQKVYGAAVFDGLYLAALENEVYACPISGNPLDASAWQPVRSARVRYFVPFANGLYAYVEYTGESWDTAGLWWIGSADEAGNRAVVRLRSEIFTSFYTDRGSAVFINNAKAIAFSPENPTQADREWNQNNSWTNLTVDDAGVYWAACGYDGLQALAWDGAALLPTGTKLGNYGPRRDYCYYMTYAGDRLLIAGGRLDPYDTEHYPGTLMYYENRGWTSFQENGIAEITGNPYRDMTCIAQDPRDATHHYATAAGTGLFEFRNGNFIRYFSNNNSPLVSAAPDGSSRYVRTDGLNFDTEGNLWMVNNQCDTIIRILKADSTWSGIYIEAIADAPTCEKTLFDAAGRFWVASRRTVSNHNGGLLCLDYNGTIDNTRDDVSEYRSEVVNQNGESYTLYGVYALVEDRNGAIWFGSDVGVFVVPDPAAWFDSDFSVTQPLVPRNDGTNYADYLLNGVSVTALAVDGGNRKWIGTGGSGLYLVNADGTEVLEQFTMENSPLPSNNIYSLAVNAITGEVMVGTEKGLVSYNAGVTVPAPALEKSNVKVYPNPVRPEYNGSVTVTGLIEGADVKVTNVAGQVVAGGVAEGGSFIWDARLSNGNRVPTGVYFVVVATGEGKKGLVAKVVVI